MQVINVRNVHHALPEALYQLQAVGVERDSRNGPVIQFPEPVTTVYRRPCERVIFWPERDANPFFHLFEALWMLAGREDVKYVANLVPRMSQYSDDGVSLSGAYGYRWRYMFGYDQLCEIINALREDPDDRRQVLSMWDPTSDLLRGYSRDVPCNLQVIFQVNCDGRLDMMVTNRSNDLVWGAYGANAVHMSMLHEYVATCIGVRVGVYRQVSANLHVYKEVFGQVANLAEQADSPGYARIVSPYENEFPVTVYPLMSRNKVLWDLDCERFLALIEHPETYPLPRFEDDFFNRVAGPMWSAWMVMKDKSNPSRFDTAISILEDCEASDWHLACVQWINRRQERQSIKDRAKDDGVSYE